VQFLPKSVQPFRQSRWSSRLDGLEALPIHSRRALIGLRQQIRVDQNVLAVYLVVELMKTEFRLVLRLSIQFDLKFRILSGVARLIANHQSFPPSQTHQK
jgi:hypothetical protein